jgi:hypothetical protein
VALTEELDNARPSFVLNATQLAFAQKATEITSTEEGSSIINAKQLFIPDDDTLTGEPNSEVAATDDSASPPIKQEPESASPPAEEPRPAVEKRAASPDPVSDEETRPLKKAATARSLSLVASQRLAGPGNTPARVEKITSTNTIASGTSRGMQIVLDTTGASWNLKPGHEGQQRKCPHLADVNISGRSSEKMADEEDGDDDGCEVSDKPTPSTAVNRPDNEDGAPKSEPKPKPKAGAPASIRADDAEPTSSEELHDSSASAPPSNTATATASSSRDAVSGIQTEVARTLPNPECDPPRASIPEPEGGKPCNCIILLARQ